MREQRPKYWGGWRHCVATLPRALRAGSRASTSARRMSLIVVSVDVRWKVSLSLKGYDGPEMLPGGAPRHFSGGAMMDICPTAGWRARQACRPPPQRNMSPFATTRRLGRWRQGSAKTPPPAWRLAIGRGCPIARSARAELPLPHRAAGP